MKLLFFANNPGGFQAMLPVALKFSDQPLILTTTIAKLKPTEREASLVASDISVAELEHLINQQQPDVIIAGSSVPNAPGGQLENQLRVLANEKNIPSVCILDHWSHYKERFCFKNQDTPDALPTQIAVMDKRAKEAMINQGIDDSKVVITGQPAFDHLLDTIKPQLPGLREKLRNELNLDNKTKLIGFISEPLSDDHGNKRGYDEMEVANDLLETVALHPRLRLAIRRHPRDSEDKFNLLIEKFAPLPVIEATSLDAYAFSAACDFIIGMSSIFLIQALLLNLNVISYQPNTNLKSDWVNSIYPVPCLTKLSDVEEKLQSTAPLNHVEFYSEQQATKNVMGVIKSLLG